MDVDAGGRAVHVRARGRARHLPLHRVTVRRSSGATTAIEAVATVDGRAYTQGYDVIEHRDLETRYLYHPASTSVRGVDVTIAPGLKVGYVMGIGDEVPAGIAQLGASVTLLGEQDLAIGRPAASTTRSSPARARTPSATT